MKKALILTLLCANVVLLLALVLGTTTPRAQAQPVVVGNPYIMIPARIQSNTSAVWVLNMAKQTLGAFYYDRNANAAVAIGRPRSLKNDFPKP